MGTKVDCKSYLPGFFSMRDLNEDSSTDSWPLFYANNNNTIQNGHYHNSYPSHNKDTLKQKMLEHEAVFKNQVHEMHRLYRIQRDMMEEVKRKHRASMEPASSTSLQESQIPYENARKWHMAGFPLSGSVKNNTRTFSGVNNSTTKESEPFDPRPLKVRKKLFDLRLPADGYIDTEEETEEPKEYNTNGGPASSSKLSIGGRSIGFADLNEPVQIEERIAPSCVDFLGSNSGRPANSKAGSTSGNLSSVTQIRPPVIYPMSGYNSREDLWRERLRNGLEPSDRFQNHSNNPFSNNSSCFATSWAKPTNNFAQKVVTLETLSTNRNHQQYTSKLNPGFGSESTLNGFFHAPASGSKEQLNCSRGDNIVVASSNGSNFRNGSILANSKPALDINLNEEVFPKSPSNEIEILQDLNTTALPWLKPRRLEPSRKSSNLCASSSNQFSSKNETGRDLNQLFVPKVTSGSDCKKILGCRVFERDARDDELSPIASTSAKPQRKNGMIDINVACEPDEDEIIAAAAVELVALEKEKEKPKNGDSIRDYIDLNSCVSDCEEESPSLGYEKRKIALEIDLEVPFLMESEDDDFHSTLSKENIPDKESLKPVIDHQTEQTVDEVLTTAAETMIAISSSCPQIQTPDEASLSEALLWLANSLSSQHANECEMMTAGKESPQMDEFEAMVLEIAEMKEEDYMPKPFVLLELVETGPAALPTRPRRGNARRGRQKRDFQRDILPGLVSLSRHEVTEDFQTFGGLMRATGHSWTRRNGAARGRKRAVVETARAAVETTPVGPVVIAPLEDRSLTGWGKTTRRPRRQRCPAGNSNNTPAVAFA
ncbi:hypothetical protein MIMGU_mgv1a001386mg [Erythranthe guttata]|uniref:Uncharacterized protein n=1 Tax=Erythranthe guttata TaxID=4155 RepID=A0A022Q1F4_ERYGU|nr:hypothetical protein MIMGU_mgv1a001386mg [Erythranthe guttata]